MAKFTVEANSSAIPDWNSPPRPRKQRRKVDEPDRLSALPDEILCHILSFIPSKYAFATSVLSTRWKSLWKMVPVLDFVNDPETPDKEFHCMVNKIMRNRKTLSTTRVRIKNPDLRSHPVHVDLWVSDAVDWNVEHLSLSLICLSKSAWPDSLFTCGTLVTLKLKGLFCLTVPSCVNLPSLKTLHLTVNYSLNSSKNSDSIARLLSGCPVLEVFCTEIVHCPDESFQISVPLLKRLKINFNSSRVRKLEINTPSLQSFELCGFHNVQDYVLGDLTNVVDANIDCRFTIDDLGDDSPMEEMLENLNAVGAVFKLLRALRNVQSLSIPDFLDENMMVDPLDTIMALPQFDHLVRLKLNHHRYGFLFLYFEELLEKCPRLQELVIDKDCCWSGEPYWESLEPSKTVPACLSSHLTLFEHTRYHESDIPFTAHILNCAKVLKVAKIQTNHYEYELQHKFQILQEISKLPRKSHICAIEFE